MVQDKACTLFIGLKAKFLSDKTYLYVGFVTVAIKSAQQRTTHDAQNNTYALQMAASAESRSRSTNMSIR